ncbi:putative indole-3-acetic acid-amido synthetase GH3.1-like [Capsicum annuum]|nr:putative indole-3-acetic acid-amido synthetase GH3.1-like [Capsicum annuum]
MKSAIDSAGKPPTPVCRKDLAEAPPKDDGILGISSEDSEDDDFNPGDPDKDESVKTESSSSNFTFDSEDFSLIVDNNMLRGDEQGVFSSIYNIMPNSASQDEKAKVGQGKRNLLRNELSYLMQSVSPLVSAKRHIERCSEDVEFVIGLGNEYVQRMAGPQQAQAWIEQHVQPYHTQTKITCITIGKYCRTSPLSWDLRKLFSPFLWFISTSYERQAAYSAGSYDSYRENAHHCQRHSSPWDTIMRQKVSKESPSSPKMIGEPLGTESKSNMNYASCNRVEKLEPPKRCSNGKKCHSIDMSEGDVLIQDASGKESGKPTVEVDLTNQGSNVTPCNRASKAKNWCLHFIKQGGVLKVSLRMQLFFFLQQFFKYNLS